MPTRIYLPAPAQAPSRAVVIGASIAGLGAARVLADHVQEVVILEKDTSEALGSAPGDGNRRGVPQGRHVHALLVAGLRSMEARFPGLQAELAGAGATTVNMGADASWHVFGGLRPRYRSGLDPVAASRPLIERTVRRLALEHPRIRVIPEASWTGMELDAAGAVTAATFSDPVGTQHRLPATLIVDASGRGSRTPSLLTALGYPAPEEVVVSSKAGYATRMFARPPASGPRPWELCYVQPGPPAGTRGGIIAPVEGDRMIVTLIGMAGDHPPTEEAAFLAFAQSLPIPDFAAFILSAQPLGPIVGFARAENRRRLYESVPRRPEGLLVIGDAACALNPVYGQGMTVATQAADALAVAMSRQYQGGRLQVGGLAARFQSALARVLATPWMMASGEDMRWPLPEFAAGKSLPARALDGYLDGVQRASLTDPRLCEAFYRVAQLLDSPVALLSPVVIGRVLLAQLRTRRITGGEPGRLTDAPARTAA